MSVHDQAAVAVLSQVALAADGAVLGLALAYIAVRSVIKYKTTASALNKVKNAPSVSVSDLRSVISNCSDQDTDTVTDTSGSSDEKIVIVRGVVETKSVVNGNWKKQNVLVSHESNEKAVILQRTQTCIYNEWRGFFGWTSDFRSMFARHWKEQETSSLRTGSTLHSLSSTTNVTRKKICCLSIHASEWHSAVAEPHGKGVCGVPGCRLLSMLWLGSLEFVSLSMVIQF